MTDRLSIALDVMGGDSGVEVVLPAALRALEKRDDLELILVGDQEIIERDLQALGGAGNERLRAAAMAARTLCRSRTTGVPSQNS